MAALPRFAVRVETADFSEAPDTDFAWFAAFIGESTMTAVWAAATSGGVSKSGISLLGLPRARIRG